MSYLKQLLSAVALSLLIAGPATALTLKIATIAPNGTNWMKELKSTGKEITQKTEGRVKLKFFPGGIMGNDQSVMRKMRVGQLHGGALSGGALSLVYSGVQIYSLPFLFNNYDEVKHVRKILDPTVTEGLAKKGFVVLGISEGGFAHLFSDKPIHRLSDLFDQKVWVPEQDKITRFAFETAGITPIPLPVADVYTGLQTGLLNTVGINPTGAIALQWHTKVNHMVDRPLLFLMGFLVVDKKTFNKLSAEDQAIVHQAVAAAFERLDESNRQDDQKAKQALQENGIELVSIADTAYNEWQSIARDALDQLADKQAYEKDLYSAVERSLEDYRKDTGG